MGLRIEWWLAFGLGLFLIVGSEAQLEVGFYDDKCLLAEAIVRGEVTKAYLRDPGVAAGLIRMHFHDCFVRGCDGSVLIDSVPPNKAEKDSKINNPSLRGFEVIDNAKFRLEDICSGVVSCADIIAFAARDSVELTGGLGYDVPAGRRDGPISLASETFSSLPSPRIGLAQVTQAFTNKGLTQEDMVTLSGAHSIGRSHCSSFSNRLYGFNSTLGLDQDPSLDPNYAAHLKRRCPRSSRNRNVVVPMNPSSPNFLDNSYYQDILANRGLFTSDQTLSDPETLDQVIQNAEDGFTWNINFAAAMVKMGQIDVLTGDDGEIRFNCRRPN
ncbi:peroxidase 5-like [Magnolia sinica]|uniref:peroxidase 5-like n=1 Tax=Magnolia sinica TaxID=86752 RepID=UPI00265A05A0|nr:peroxidase 5-like [Magnolia sinica]